MLTAKSLQRDAFKLITSALFSVRAYHDAIQVLGEAIILSDTPEELLKLRSHVREQSRLQELSLQSQTAMPSYIQQSMKQGRVQRVEYPWISPDELGRGNKAMKKVKAKIETVSMNATLGTSTVGGAKSDNFGVFARKDISRNEPIMIEKSIYTVLSVQTDKNCWACVEPLSNNTFSSPCCKVRYCSESCKTEAMKTYHRALCDKDFQWLFEACKDAEQVSSDMIPLLLLKVLATAVQQNASPLKGESFRSPRHYCWSRRASF